MIVHVLIHCTADGADVGGFWTGRDEYVYRSAFADLKASGEEQVAAFDEDADWADIVTALSGQWSASGGWMSFDMEDITAYDLMPDEPQPRKAARKKSK